MRSALVHRRAEKAEDAGGRSVTRLKCSRIHSGSARRFGFHIPSYRLQRACSSVLPRSLYRELRTVEKLKRF